MAIPFAALYAPAAAAETLVIAFSSGAVPRQAPSEGPDAGVEQRLRMAIADISRKEAPAGSGRLRFAYGVWCLELAGAIAFELAPLHDDLAVILVSTPRSSEGGIGSGEGGGGDGAWHCLPGRGLEAVAALLNAPEGSYPVPEGPTCVRQGCLVLAADRASETVRRSLGLPPEPSMRDEIVWASAGAFAGRIPRLARGMLDHFGGFIVEASRGKNFSGEAAAAAERGIAFLSEVVGPRRGAGSSAVDPLDSAQVAETLTRDNTSWGREERAA